MADNQNVLDALKKLDPNNDDHWTADKQPKVEAVNSVLDDPGVTRAEITAAAEGFNRDTATGFFMTAGAPAADGAKPWEQGAGKDTVDAAEINPAQATAIDGPDQNPGQNADGVITGKVKDELDKTAGEDGDNIDAEGAPSGVPTGTADRVTEDSPGPPFNPADPVQAPSGDGSTGPETAAELTTSPRAEGAEANNDTASGGADGPNAGDGETEQPEMEQPDDGSDEVGSLETSLRSRREKLDALRLKLNEAQEEFNSAQGEVDRILERIEQLRPKNSHQGTIQAYLERQKEIGRERGENRAALRSAGVSLKELQKAVGKSPVDEAFARKNGRGGRRPTRA